MVRLAVDAIVGSTTRPLLFSWFAVLVALLLALGLLVASWLLGPQSTPPGAVICFCAALILIGQGVQGLYLSRLFENTRGRPLYLISDVTGFSTGQNRNEVRDLPAAATSQASRSTPAPYSPLQATLR
jgi:dolichol-phosphate mannosyltransferase